MHQIGKSIWDWIARTVLVVLTVLYKMLGRELTQETVSGFMQFVKFGIVGVSNTVISYVLYMVTLFVLKKAGMLPHADYLAAQGVAFVLSVLWSFYWNQKTVFVLKEGQQRSMWKALLKTYVSYSFTGLFLCTALLVLWVQVLHISEFVAPLINLVVSVPVNFLINKFWAFK